MTAINLTLLFPAPAPLHDDGAEGELGPATERPCAGCRHHPDATCAACNRPTAFALAVGERCAMALCAACHELLLALRAPGAPSLVYVPLAPPEDLEAKRAESRARVSRAKTA